MRCIATVRYASLSKVKNTGSTARVCDAANHTYLLFQTHGVRKAMIRGVPRKM